MKKISKKLWGIILSICLITPLFGNVAQAATGSISISGGSGKVGSTVSVTCTVKCSEEIGTADVTLQYDQAGLEYVSGSGGYSLSGGSGRVSYKGLTSNGTEKSLSFTVKFKITKEGSFKVSSTHVSAYSLNEELLSVGNTSATITGKAETTSNSNNNNSNNSNNSNNNNNSGSNNNTTTTPETPKDSNSKLKSLDVYPGSLRPAFSAGTTSYTVDVTSDVTEVTITAAAESSKAKVSVSGGKDLKLGDNAAKVVVTAEDGSVTVYNIKIVCGEVEKITVNDAEHTINEAIADESVPAGFTKTTVTYNGREYVGLVNESQTITLMSLSGAESTTYYIYDQANQAFYNFIPVKIAEGKYIYLMPLDEANTAFAGYEKIAITVGEMSVDTWKLDEAFSVVRAWDGNAQEVFYQYDSVDGTYQRFVEIEMMEPELPEEPEKEQKGVLAIFAEYYLYIIIGLGALVLILVIAVICLAVTRKTKRGKGKARERRKAKKEAQNQVENKEEINTETEEVE